MLSAVHADRIEPVHLSFLLFIPVEDCISSDPIKCVIFKWSKLSSRS